MHNLRQAKRQTRCHVKESLPRSSTKFVCAPRCPTCRANTTAHPPIAGRPDRRCGPHAPPAASQECKPPLSFLRQRHRTNAEICEPFLLAGGGNRVPPRLHQLGAPPLGPMVQDSSPSLLLGHRTSVEVCRLEHLLPLCSLRYCCRVGVAPR